MSIDKLTGIEKTLLFPLWGRYSESKKSDGIIHDNKCIEIVEKNNIDFTKIEKEQHPANRIAWFSRAWNVDLELNKIINEHTDVTIVNLGCGLDTTYYRINNTHIKWVDVDLRNVITLRKELFDENTNVIQIAGSVLDDKIYREVKCSKTMVVIAVGLLYYFTKEQVVDIFKNIKLLKKEHLFVILDYCSEIGVKIANKLILANSENVQMIWHANTEKELIEINQDIHVIENYRFFTKILSSLTEQQRIMALQSDQNNISNFAVIEIKNDVY